MRIQTHIKLSALCVGLTLAACGEESSPVEVEGDIARECEDNRDNDGDGVVDCRDPGCADAPICDLPIGDTGGTDADAEDTSGTDAEDTGDTTDAGDETDTSTDADALPDTDDAGDDTTDDTTGDTNADADATDAGDTTDVEPDTTPTAGGPVRSCTTEVRYRPLAGATSVWIAGSFNGWSPTATPMADTDGDGVYTVSLDLDAGEYPYKHVYRIGSGEPQWEFTGISEIPSPIDFYTQWDGGNENRSLRVGDCDVPTIETVTASGGTDGVSATLQFVRASSGALLDPDELRVTIGGDTFTPVYDAETGRITINATGLPNGKHSIRLWASDADGNAIEHEPHFIPLWVEDEPFEWRDATMYFVFTDRFRNGDFGEDIPQNRPIADVPTIANYQGGDFLGTIQAIEEGYFDAMGVNLLWLSPVSENPEGRYLAADRFHGFTGFHGYWPTSARQIEFRWSDARGEADERLKQLIDAAHERGIRVMFDIALNHVHEDHDYVTNFPEWFTAAPCSCTNEPGACNWDTNPIGCWFIDYLPDLDYKIHAIVEQVSDDVEWLVREFDVDSFRIDAAKHMNHVIMRRVALRLRDSFERGGGAPFYLVGETYTGGDGHGLIMQYVNDHELDGQFDFPLLYPIRDAFAGSGSFRNLSNGRRTSEEQYGDAYFAMSPFLGNHDIPRFSQIVHTNGAYVDPWSGATDPMNGDLNDSTWNIINRMSLGFAFVLTQPGIPLIYYGDEIGLYGAGDPDNRRPMRFEPFLSEPNRTLLSRVQAIGVARQEHEALRRGDFRELWVDDNFFVYARDNGGGDVVIVAMNKGTGRAQGIPVPTDLAINGRNFVNTLTDASPRRIQVRDNNMTVTLSQWEYAIFVVE
jgi:glycosidase